MSHNSTAVMLAGSINVTTVYKTVLSFNIISHDNSILCYKGGGFDFTLHSNSVIKNETINSFLIRPIFWSFPY